MVIVFLTDTRHGKSPVKGSSLDHHRQRTSSLATSFTDSEDPLRFSFGDLKEPGSDFEVIYRLC